MKRNVMTSLIVKAVASVNPWHGLTTCALDRGYQPRSIFGQGPNEHPATVALQG